MNIAVGSAMMGAPLVSIAIPEQRIIKPDNLPQDICYQDVINYQRSCIKGQHSCVMCGKFNSKDCVIPSQNKDVCKRCDSLVWWSEQQGLQFKFCKGCKNFVSLYDFVDKPRASKCGKCRNRCRTSYSARRTSSGSSDSYENDFTRHLISGNSPRGVTDRDSSFSSDSADMDMDNALHHQLGLLQKVPTGVPIVPKTPVRTYPHSDGRFALPGDRRWGIDPTQGYTYDRDKDVAAYMSPAMFGIASPFAGVGSLEKENLDRRSVSRPRIGGVLGDRTASQDNIMGVSKTPRAADAKKDQDTPSNSLRLPRIPNSLLNIHSASKRAAAVEEPAATPAPASAGKGVLDDMLLLNTFLRKSPLTFISGMPTPEVQAEYAGFGSEHFSPSQHRRMYQDQRTGAQTPGVPEPLTPVLDNTAGFIGGAQTPSSIRSWDSQEGGAWYHDVLIAMSKDKSIKKRSPPVVGFSETRGLDEVELPVAKRIRFGDAPSLSPAGQVRAEARPPTTPWIPTENPAAVSRGSLSCPPVSRSGDKKSVTKIDLTASCSKVGCSKSGQEKWEWDPNANPLMHLAMVLSKNESNEEEIFRDLSSDSSCGDGSSDSESVHSFRDQPSPAPEEMMRGYTPVPGMHAVV
jgi:hypothetical protein